MPSINTPLGARPARFRRARVLIVGCGDVGMRAARELRGRVQLMALTASPERRAELRAAGLVPLAADLDRPATLRRFAGLATHVLDLAPPASVDGPHSQRDMRTRALVGALRRRTLPHVFVYGSTSGVYGDCGGARITEARPVRPLTPRAHRRVDAERSVRWLGRAGVATRILRIPGIYAADRAGGTPRERLLRGTPVLRHADDVYTNHIHADDLARLCVAALWRGGTQRVFHASDDTRLKMGDYMDLAADLYGLLRPRRIAYDEAKQVLPASLLSFMGESRQLDNARMKRELRVRLRHATVHSGLVGERR